MNVSSVTTFGSAAIASPPANNSSTAIAKPDDNKPDAPAIEPAAKPPGTGQFVDKSV